MDKDKLKSVGFLRKKGKSEIVTVLNEDTGEVGGMITKHWDGRQDANVTPQPVTATSKVQKGGKT